ncbi:uncharacterized protein BDR25DRAFT_360774 [Lindgomyces ingoldianus]|uniref:Uncharacterized protein n=1 Tax=Lindgomyces ingoldianus TaxID=673940 RepID=A0ACB6QE27_9PLEO|nr:uncharacterized protein BDR25DRAFT_360774 [Lindgomyces ingoldianus]KAF2465152.1 hypothetical protein BDR25DRAFT_360774 [Lindgomyces ingoldianus]
MCVPVVVANNLSRHNIIPPRAPPQLTADRNNDDFSVSKRNLFHNSVPHFPMALIKRQLVSSHGSKLRTPTTGILTNIKRNSVNVFYSDPIIYNTVVRSLGNYVNELWHTTPSFTPFMTETPLPPPLQFEPDPKQSYTNADEVKLYNMRAKEVTVMKNGRKRSLASGNIATGARSSAFFTSKFFFHPMKSVPPPPRNFAGFKRPPALERRPSKLAYAGALKCREFAMINVMGEIFKAPDKPKTKGLQKMPGPFKELRDAAIDPNDGGDDEENKFNPGENLERIQESAQAICDYNIETWRNRQSNWHTRFYEVGSFTREYIPTNYPTDGNSNRAFSPPPSRSKTDIHKRRIDIKIGRKYAEKDEGEDTICYLEATKYVLIWCGRHELTLFHTTDCENLKINSGCDLEYCQLKVEEADEGPEKKPGKREEAQVKDESGTESIPKGQNQQKQAQKSIREGESINSLLQTHHYPESSLGDLMVCMLRAMAHGLLVHALIVLSAIRLKFRHLQEKDARARKRVTNALTCLEFELSAEAKWSYIFLRSSEAVVGEQFIPKGLSRTSVDDSTEKIYLGREAWVLRASPPFSMSLGYSGKHFHRSGEDMGCLINDDPTMRSKCGEQTSYLGQCRMFSSFNPTSQFASHVEIPSEYLTSLFGLSSKTAILTRATGGLGSAMAIGLAKAGADTVSIEVLNDP